MHFDRLALLRWRKGRVVFGYAAQKYSVKPLMLLNYHKCIVGSFMGYSAVGLFCALDLGLKSIMHQSFVTMAVPWPPSTRNMWGHWLFFQQTPARSPTLLAQSTHIPNPIWCPPLRLRRKLMHRKRGIASHFATFLDISGNFVDVM